MPVLLAQLEADSGPLSISIVSPIGETIRAASPWPTRMW